MQDLSFKEQIEFILNFILIPVTTLCIFLGRYTIF
jgi:hypothetical protein